MSDRPNPSRQFEDGVATGVAIGVAVIGRDADGAFVVTACNHHFLQMTGAASMAARTFPVALDTLIRDEARLALRETLHACSASGEAPGHGQTREFDAGVARRRLSIQPLMHAGSPAGGGTAAHEWLVTCQDVAPKVDLSRGLEGGPEHGLEREHEHERGLERELEVSATRFRAVVDSAYDAIVTIDEQHNITLFNRSAENLFGYTSAEMLGRPIETLMPERFRPNHSRNVNQFANSPLMNLRSVTPPRMDESNSVYGRHRDGTIIPVEIAISKINVGGVVEFTAVVRDITERAQLMALLKQQAVTDALTGLPNRRECLEFVERVLGTDDMLSVFILDIDHFKAINDNHGHDIGDEVLRVLAKVGMSITHASKLFARWGGEEFVAALPGADAALALEVANDLRERVEQQGAEHAWRVQPVPFTVSIGVVTRAPGERDVDALMRRADRALYRAKQAGRNRVEVG